MTEIILAALLGSLATIVGIGCYCYKKSKKHKFIMIELWDHED